MSPLFQLVLFNFYSDGRPYLVALFIQQLVLFNNCFIQLLIPLDESLIPTGFIQLLFRWPPLFGHTFYSTTGFIQQLFYSTAYSPYSTFYSNGRPYLVALFIQLLIFIQLVEWAALIWSPLFYSLPYYN